MGRFRLFMINQKNNTYWPGVAARLDPWRNPKSQFRVTFFKPAGVYPLGCIRTAHSAIWIDQEIAFMVARCTPWAENLPYSDVVLLNPEEIRLLGSIMMTERFDGGQRSSFWVVPKIHLYIGDGFDAKKFSSIVWLKKQIILRIQQGLLDYDKSWAFGWAAGIGGGFPRDWLDFSDQASYWKRISIYDSVLMRGVYSLIKSDMLALIPEFREEATFSTFVALDASFEMVLRHLRKKGVSSPTSRDAGEWLYQTFDKSLGLTYEVSRYFEVFYERRVQSLHPASRYGDIPYAPLEWDDYSHLRSVLPGLFGYLVRRRHADSMLETFRAAELRTNPIFE